MNCGLLAERPVAVGRVNGNANSATPLPWESIFAGQMLEISHRPVPPRGFPPITCSTAPVC
jgi:hypothetical protein